MHHQIVPIPCKPYSLNWLPERLLVSHYEDNYGGAVRSLNALRHRLAILDLTSAPVREVRALKHEELAAMSSVVLHELYFGNLTGERKQPLGKLAAALEADFGTVEKWRRQFVGLARSLDGHGGWVTLSYCPHDHRLYNQIMLDDTRSLPGAVPILVLDMYEHAYHLEFGANAAAYIDAFMRLVDWTAVGSRLEAPAGQQRRESLVSADPLPSISVEELSALMATEPGLQVVDARPRNYVSRNPGTMPQAIWRDPESVDDWYGQLSSDAPVFVYCAYGFEVGCKVATTLRERGFDARYIRGGLAAWNGTATPRGTPR
jgi:Fe-Mn family superoxide dismutase